ncbi:MAG: N-acetylmuramoyl-L-alanine amidase [Treponemataceae bacterium]|nr:N-acetylmuramoyl-L-alanine amidase [Treponemataceae bacterium]
MKKRLCIFVIVVLISAAFAQNTENLVTSAEKTGAQVYWDSLSGTGILEKNGHQLSFRAGDAVVLQDYKTIALTDAPELRDGVLYVSRQFLSLAEKVFVQTQDDAGYHIGAVLIDPGHGGKDPGAMDTHTINGKKVTVKEKDVNLAVGKMLYSRLKSAYPDKKILMTRDTDTFLSLSQRTDIANSVKLKDGEAILYVSVHVNSSLDKKASGYEVWYLSPGTRRTVLDKNATDDKNLFDIMNSMMEEEFTTESILIAKFIMDGLQTQVGNLATARGIKAEEWFVVKNSNMPAVLVEVGFLSNQKEAALLVDNAYLQKLSLGIYNGLAAFVTHFERSRGFTGSK